MERYSRQILVNQIGESGQEKLQKSRVLVVGCGALGTVVANNLVRAGIGYLRIVDRDYVELDNLQRQMLFDEDDVAKVVPKALAAADKLSRINSSVKIAAEVTDVNRRNIEELLQDIDIVVDGTDNFEARFLLNDACFKHKIPWVYGAALATYGMTMNIIPGVTACFRSLVAALPAPGAIDTCDTVGVLNAITSIVASLQSNEAIKILLGAKNLSQELVLIDLAHNSFEKMAVKERPDCPLCHRGEFEYLNRKGPFQPIKLCGREMVQVTPQREMEVSLEYLKGKLEKLGEVTYLGSLLKFKVGEYELTVFPDGRAFINGCSDEKIAKSLYTRYIGV